MVLKETPRLDLSAPIVKNPDDMFLRFLTSNPLLTRYTQILPAEFRHLTPERKNFVIDILEKTRNTIKWDYIGVSSLIKFTNADSHDARLSLLEKGTLSPPLPALVEYITSIQKSDLLALSKTVKKGDKIRGYEVRITFIFNEEFTELSLRREIRELK